MVTMQARWFKKICSPTEQLYGPLQTLQEFSFQWFRKQDYKEIQQDTCQKVPCDEHNCFGRLPNKGNHPSLKLEMVKRDICKQQKNKNGEKGDSLQEVIPQDCPSSFCSLSSKERNNTNSNQNNNQQSSDLSCEGGCIPSFGSNSSCQPNTNKCKKKDKKKKEKCKKKAQKQELDQQNADLLCKDSPSSFSEPPCQQNYEKYIPQQNSDTSCENICTPNYTQEKDRDEDVNHPEFDLVCPYNFPSPDEQNTKPKNCRKNNTAPKNDQKEDLSSHEESLPFPEGLSLEYQDSKCPNPSKKSKKDKRKRCFKSKQESDSSIPCPTKQKKEKSCRKDSAKEKKCKKDKSKKKLKECDPTCPPAEPSESPILSSTRKQSRRPEHDDIDFESKASQCRDISKKEKQPMKTCSCPLSRLNSSADARRPKRKQLHGKKTKGNASLYSIKQDCQYNCCTCCKLLAEYMQEVCRLITARRASELRISQILCDMCNIVGCLCNSCYVILKRVFRILVVID